MTDQLSAEAIYLRLGGLIAETPDLKADPTPATHRWVAQVSALIYEGNLVDTSSLAILHIASRNLGGVLRENNASTVLAIMHQAFARAELRAPPKLKIEAYELMWLSAAPI